VGAGRDSIQGAPADLDEFQSWLMEQGWGDGLPAIPPTAERVKRMLGLTRGKPDEVVAVLVPRLGRATMEAVAANAVMAGALPEHMPVILAALEALADPSFNLQAVQTTTHPCSPSSSSMAPSCVGSGSMPRAMPLDRARGPMPP